MMRKLFQRGAWAGWVILLLLTGCWGGPLPQASLPATTPPTIPATATVEATVPISPTRAEPAPSSMPVVEPRLRASAVRLFPIPLVTGDMVSLDLIPDLPAGEDAQWSSINLTLPDGNTLEAAVEPQGLDGVSRARFYWFWSTKGLSGTQPLTLTLVLPPEVVDPNPADNTVVLSVTLESPTVLWPPEPGTRWAVTETGRLRLHYLTGSAAERDLPVLVEKSESVYREAAARLAPATNPVDIYLLDRVIGQGGYAADTWIAISYVDRSYFPSDLRMLLLHELIHRLDDAIECGGAPAFVREGLAVYLGGGHYRRESLPRKAAAVFQAGRWVPLADLTQNFYTHQHEVAYLEAGALLAYLAETGSGWESVTAFCRAAAGAEGSELQQFETGLQALGFESLPAFEREWQRRLGAVNLGSTGVDELELELHYMDTMRAYQVQYDLPAHFLKGILFNLPEAERRGITADFVRHPRTPEALTLELLLVSSENALMQGRLEEVRTALSIVDDVLARGFPATGTAADIRTLVAEVLKSGYEPYRLTCPEPGRCSVYVLDREHWPDHRMLQVNRTAAGWEIR